METKDPLIDESVVSIISFNGYWHLHRVLNGVHYFGHFDHRIGLSIRTETPDKIKNWATREPKIFESFTSTDGKLIEYWDEPYTTDQIKSFINLTEEELIEWVNRGF